MTKYIANAFSLNMIPAETLGALRFRYLGKLFKGTIKDGWVESKGENEGEDLDLADAISCVDHADTAAMLGVPMNRISVTLKSGDKMIVAQYKGPRMTEGETTLPEGAVFELIEVRLV